MVSIHSWEYAPAHQGEHHDFNINVEHQPRQSYSLFLGVLRWDLDSFICKDIFIINFTKIEMVAFIFYAQYGNFDQDLSSEVLY